MICKTCNTENKPDSKFCIVCGSPLEKESTRICPNGHVYDISLSKCPYCPSDELKTQIASGETFSSESTKTFVPGETGTKGLDNDKTRIMTSEGFGKGSHKKDKRTVIVSPDEKDAGIEDLGRRKIVGWLITFTWDKNGQDYKLFEGRNKIGGNPEADIHLSDPAVSDPHCMILYREGKFKIKDELSTNGTLINDESIEECELKDGDVIKMGKTELTFRKV